MAGLIDERWNADGRPILNSAELLSRTISADIELERLGENPAKKFRKLRYDNNRAGMYSYIGGFYQYPFAPNYRDNNPLGGSQTLRSDSKRTRNHSADFAAKTKPFSVSKRSSIITYDRDVGSSALVDLYDQLSEEHPHDLLPLESKLPWELRADRRDQFRIVMTMILSGSTGDYSLSQSLARLFSRHISFEKFRGLKKLDIQEELKRCGFGYNDPDRGGNGGRLWSVLQCYFGTWKENIDLNTVATLRNMRGFGPKFVPLLEAYAFGNLAAFPLDSPAFTALKSFGFYTKAHLDFARDDIMRKLKDKPEITLIDFHELLRFRWQFGEIRRSSFSANQKRVIIGWNGWRVMSSLQASFISLEWIRSNLIKDNVLAAEFMNWFSKQKL